MMNMSDEQLPREDGVPPGEATFPARPAAAEQFAAPQPRTITARPLSGPMNPTMIGPKRAALGLAICVGGLVLINLMITVLAAVVAGVAGRSVQDAMIGGTIVSGLISLAFIIYLLHMHGARAAHIGLGFRDFGLNLLLGLGLAPLSFAVFFGASVVVAFAIPGALEDMQSNPERILENIPRLSVPLIILFSLIIGIYEEAIFRGYLITMLHRLTRSWWGAVLLSSLFFAAVHVFMQGWITVLLLTPVAILWSVAAVWRRSLVPSIVAHFLFNSIQMYAMFHGMMRPEDGGSMEGGAAALVRSLAAFLLGC